VKYVCNFVLSSYEQESTKCKLHFTVTLSSAVRRFGDESAEFHTGAAELTNELTNLKFLLIFKKQNKRKQLNWLKVQSMARKPLYVKSLTSISGLQNMEGYCNVGMPVW
jgi:hypothetical protein